MCETLAEVQGAITRIAERFDAASHAPADCARVMARAAEIEKIAGTLKGFAAAGVAESGEWKQSGAPSPAHHVARTTGISVSQAVDTIETARRLAELPETAAAARRGELSLAQASAIAAAAEMSPDAEVRLLQQANRVSLNELRAECARTRAAAHADLEERRRRIHAERFLRTWVDPEGASHLHMRDNPEVVAGVMAAIEPVRDRIFNEARLAGKPEPSEAYAADALAAAVSGGADTPGKAAPVTKVILRGDIDAIVRGHPVEGEVCEIAGYGPVAVSVVREALAEGNAFIALVATRGTDVVNVVHLGRKPTAHQRTALEWLFPTCTVEGCNCAGRHLEIDHRTPWAEIKRTLLGELDGYCHHHHDKKTYEGWALVDGHGKRPMVPPDDPRHPDHPLNPRHHRDPQTGPDPPAA